MSEKSTGDVISAIKTRKKNKGVTLLFASGEKIKLSEAAYSDFRLYEGKEVGSEEMKQLLAFGMEDEFYTYALRLLNKEIYTSYDLFNKLTHKGASYEVARSIIKRLREAKLIDDEEYARIYATDLADFRLYGKNRTIARLKEKGISDEIISRLSFPDDKELERAIRFIELLNKKLSKTPSNRKKSKAFSALLAKGYDREIAQEALKKLASTPEAIEAEALAKDFYIAKNKYYKYEDLYIRKQKIFAYLGRKGYRYEDIKRLLEEEYNEDC